MLFLFMEKIKIKEVGDKFRNLPSDTPSSLKYNLNETQLILEIKDFEHLIVCCDDCGCDKLVKEGVLFRCINCNSISLIGFSDSN